MSVQVPVPLHVSWLVWVPLKHVSVSPHVVLKAENAHEPLLQLPVKHSTFAHSLSGSRFWMLPQFPSEPVPFLAAVHAWQRDEHALVQQTPSAQKPLTHSLVPLHKVPLTLFVWQC